MSAQHTARQVHVERLTDRDGSSNQPVTGGHKVTLFE